jgi:hypothetical protein
MSGLSIGVAAGFASLQAEVPAQDPLYSNLALHINAEGAAIESGNSTFIDSSASSASNMPTAGGSVGFVTQGTFAPHSTTGWGSLYFSNATTTTNTAANIALGSNTGFAFGTGQFTIEAWVYVTNFNSNNTFPIFQATSSTSIGSGMVWFAVTPTTVIIAQHGSSVSFTPTTTINTSTWYHIAVVRSASNVTVYVNGTSIGSTTTGANGNIFGATFSQSGGLIGYVITPSNANGYISNLRITNGGAVYTTNFTPSTTPLTPIVPAGTCVLLMNGNNAAVNDLTTRMPIFTSNAVISNSTYRFGSRSLYFNGTNAYAILPYTQFSNIYAGDFTIELWVNSGNVSVQSATIAQWSQIAGNTNAGFVVMINGSGRPVFYWGPTATILMTSAVSILANNWYHIAVTRSGNNFTMWLNGASVATATNSTTFTSGNGTANGTCVVVQPITMGNYIGTSAGVVGASGINYFSGFLDEIKITQGIARYTAAFTPADSPTLAQDGTTGIAINQFYASTALQIDANGTNGSTSFTDSSRYNNTIAVQGGATISAVNPYLGSGSALFNGTNSAINTAYTSTVGSFSTTNDWTIDFFVKVSAYPAVAYCLFCSSAAPGTSYTSAGGLNFIGYMNTTGGIEIEFTNNRSTGAFVDPGYVGNVPLNTWTHVAFVYNSTFNTLRTFVAGIEVGNIVMVGMQPAISPARFTIGAIDSGYSASPRRFLSGNIDRFRCTLGQRYNGKFVPDPTSNDPNSTNISLLLMCDGANGSTTFIDTVGKTVTNVGSTAIATLPAKFGTGCASFNGSSQYLTVPDSTDLNLATGDFTVETWYNISATPGISSALITRCSSNVLTAADLQYFIGFVSGGTLTARIYSASTIYTVADLSGPLNDSKWHHVALVRSGNVFSFYVDGKLRGSITQAITLNNGAWSTYIGGNTQSGTTYYYNGYQDDIRITKGIARYTANFQAPQIAHSVQTYSLTQPIYLIVGGGGGGGGYGSSVGGGGGGAGGYLTDTFSTTPGEVLTITAGAGGAGGAGVNTDGNIGVSSSIVSSTRFPTASFVATTGTGTTTMTISSVTSGSVQIGMALRGGVTPPTGSTVPIITAFGTFNGTSGTVTLSWAPTWTSGATVTGSKFTALGGGRGAMFGAGRAGGNGGSGGGVSGSATAGVANVRSIGAQGNAGATGAGNLTVNSCSGGGGGGAGGAATNAVTTGGLGLSNDITGYPITYSTGGAGGGAGSGVAGADNTGNGGQGAGGSGTGGAGGSGVVILAMPTSVYSGVFTGSPIVTNVGDVTILKFTGAGTYTM